MIRKLNVHRESLLMSTIKLYFGQTGSYISI